MSYPTITFLLFILLTGVLYFTVPKKIQWGILLLASLAFYVCSCGSRVVFLLAATGILYGSALLLSKLDAGFALQKIGLEKAQRKRLKKQCEKKKKGITAAGIILTLLLLLGTKYCNFLGSLVNHLTTSLGQQEVIPVFQILLPLGISYYTLMGISYLVDVYRGILPAEKNPLMLLLYLCYFPHIVEGPFDRSLPLMQQFRSPHSIDYRRIKNGGIRMVWGLFKKLVIADRAGLMVNTIFADPASYDGSILLLGTILYTLQIYAEFSGCMDMVCGVSQMLDISIAENFRQPFFAVSINDFWRRWHITLGQWLKDYVFYPASLSLPFKPSTRYPASLIPAACALFFVWFSNGLWHGASGKFICYGLYYYVLMMLGQLAKPFSDGILARLHIQRKSRGYHVFQILRTCIIVCFGMLIFRAESLGQAGSIFARIFTDFGGHQIFDGTLLFPGTGLWDHLILAAGAALLLATSLWKEKGHQLRELLERQPLPLRWLLYLTLLFAIILMGAYGGDYANTTFIYGEF